MNVTDLAVPERPSQVQAPSHEAGHDVQQASRSANNAPQGVLPMSSGGQRSADVDQEPGDPAQPGDADPTPERTQLRIAIGAWFEEKGLDAVTAVSETTKLIEAAEAAGSCSRGGTRSSDIEPPAMPVAGLAAGLSHTLVAA